MQGFNMGRYVPPEHEGTTSANKLAGKHALGARARKAGQGILTVRFEMPFAIWCTTCPKPTIIGQGVRFNAEKKKVGTYYSTPIFSFRMKHVACGGTIEVRTDPKNTAYVVTEGAKKRDTGEDKVLEGEISIQTEEERERLRNDAFAALEVKIDDRRQAAVEHSRVEELKTLRDRSWSDPWAESRRLRKTFRADRKVREHTESTTEALRDKMGLGMRLLEEREEDKHRAGFVEFGALGTEDAIDKARAKPLFAVGNNAVAAAAPIKTQQADDGRRSTTRTNKKSKGKAVTAEDRAKLLAKEIRGNTRAAMDPFLVNDLDWGPSASDLEPPPLPGMNKRKRDEQDQRLTEQPERHTRWTGSLEQGSGRAGNTSGLLVDYESD
ncbi:MAG: hypothetical protein M1837_001597 [Sclerophora amabilis]|nr:MAG: hypothetical protein M1837_001597 [Sclerophora amabilis]